MKKPTILFFSNFFIILIFISFSVIILLDQDILSGISLSKKHNDFCQTFSPPSSNDPLSLLCNNKFKKSKFIWLFIDGLAYDQLLELNKTNSSIFRIKSKEYKQSGSLHDSILTGKFSRNYPARTIHIDHIFNQAKMANKTMHYLGERFPLFYLLGQEQNNVLFSYKISSSEKRAVNSLCEKIAVELKDNYYKKVIEGKVDITNHLKGKYTKYNIYDELNKHYSPNKKEMSLYFNSCLYQLSGNNNDYKSIIFYTMRIDHLNHSFDKNHLTTIIDVYGVEKILQNLFEWANQNEEYAVIVSSDHGGQPFNGEDNICNHGCDKEGNEAVLMIYTKELGFQQKKGEHNKIWVYDVAPTVAQIISNVNIPLEVQGVPREILDDNIIRYTSMKSKEIQLKMFIKKLIEKYPHLKKKLNNYYKKLEHNVYNKHINTLNDIELNANRTLYNDYILYLKKMQNKIVNEIEKNKNSILFIMSYYFIEICLIVVIYYQCKKIDLIINNENIIKERNNSKLILGIILSLLFGEVFLCFIFKSFPLYKILNISRILSFILIGIVSIIFIFKYKQINKTHIFIIILFFLIAIISFLMLHFELFINMKIFFNTYSKSIHFNFFFNYPLAIIYITYEILNCNSLYFDSKLQFKLNYIIVPLCIFMYVLFIIFDIYEPFHFVHHSLRTLVYTRLIYLVIFIYGLISFIPLYKRVQYKDIENKGFVRFEKMRSMPNIRISMFAFIFYICDETERSIMLVMVVSVNVILSKKYLQTKDIYWKLICYIGILMLSDSMYIASQNSFTFDISLKVTSKCIGKYSDETPILSGVLFGMHKMKYFMLTSAYMLSIARVSKKYFMKNETIVIRMMLNIQISVIIMLYFYFLKANMEKHYLQIFIWIMSKFMVSVLFDVCFMIWNFIYKMRTFCCNYYKSNIIISENKNVTDIKEIVPNTIVEMTSIDNRTNVMTV